MAKIVFTTKNYPRPTGLARVDWRPGAHIKYKGENIGFIQGSEIWFQVKCEEHPGWKNARMRFSQSVTFTFEDAKDFVKKNAQRIWDLWDLRVKPAQS